MQSKTYERTIKLAKVLYGLQKEKISLANLDRIISKLFGYTTINQYKKLLGINGFIGSDCIGDGYKINRKKIEEKI